MTYQGIVQNGVIVINGGAILPEGSKVSVAVIPASPSADAEMDSKPEPGSETIGQKMARIARAFADRETNLPSDLAENHDHYLHGMPKR